MKKRDEKTFRFTDDLIAYQGYFGMSIYYDEDANGYVVGYSFGANLISSISEYMQEIGKGRECKSFEDALEYEMELIQEELESGLKSYVECLEDEEEIQETKEMYKDLFEKIYKYLDKQYFKLAKGKLFSILNSMNVDYQEEIDGNICFEINGNSYETRHCSANDIILFVENLEKKREEQ